MGGGSCDLGELDSLRLLEAILPGPGPLLWRGGGGVLSMVRGSSDVLVVECKPVVPKEHTYHSYGFSVLVFLLHSNSLSNQQSFSLRKLLMMNDAFSY